MSENGFDYKQWALARFKHYREAAVAEGVDADFSLEYAYKAAVLAELLAAAGHGEALAAVVIGDVPLAESGVVLSDEKRALELLMDNHFDHHTPCMVCIPKSKWREAMELAGGS
jgi:hypothetical protein